MHTFLDRGESRKSAPGTRQSSARPGSRGRLWWWTAVFALALWSLIGLGLSLAQAQTPDPPSGQGEAALIQSAAAPAAPGPAEPRANPAAIRYRMSDCHLHLVDCLQHTDGIRAALAAMDRCGVEDVMISGMPLVKQWSASEPIQPQYYLEDDARCYWYSATDVLVAREVLSLPPEDRARLHPFICGFNAADRNAVEHIQRMLEWYPGLWQGIGEVMARHDDLTALTYGETAKADHIALDAVYDLATERDLPVLVHSNISSVWKREPIYLREMEAAVRRHPKTRFVWCHAGISRRIVIPDITQHLRRLLTTYPNLYIDLSWVVFENYLIKDGRPSQEWVGLIESFPDRFMLGSDKVARFGNYPDEILKYYVLLDALKPETARKVARLNFLAVLPQKAAFERGGSCHAYDECRAAAGRGDDRRARGAAGGQEEAAANREIARGHDRVRHRAYAGPRLSDGVGEARRAGRNRRCSEGDEGEGRRCRTLLPPGRTLSGSRR